MNDKDSADHHGAYNLQPFRRAVLRGFGVVLPPLLTIVILLWIGNSVQKFVISPVEWASRQTIVWFMNDTDSAAIERDMRRKKAAAEGAVEPQLTDPTHEPEEGTVEQTELERLAAVLTRIEAEQSAVEPAELERLAAVLSRIEAEKSVVERLAAALTRIEEKLIPQVILTNRQPVDELVNHEYEGEVYVKLPNGEWIPAYIREHVREHMATTGVPLTNVTSKGYYNYYVEHKVLRKGVIIPVFFAGFILLMYLLGKFLAAGMGRILWNSMESVITQLPIIRTVYNSVKQVTDFFVGESEIDFQRVVAVEYPRVGAWSVGFVTGESLLTIRGAANEPVVSILMPTSPVPGTGFTITVRKSETIDLDIPIEQALQFVVSCGVVVPGNEVQTHESIKKELEAAAAVVPSTHSTAIATPEIRTRS